VIVSRRELVLVLGLFIALAGVLLWPVPTHMTRDIPTSGPPTDAMLLLYALTWSAHALGNDPIGLYQATFFYPYSYSLAFMENVVGLAVLMAPVNWVFGNMCVGFNTAWLLTFVISGLGAFLLVRYLTDSTIAGILAGILFAFHPDRYHNAGQINNLAMMWIPFALLSLHLWVETRLRRHLFLFAAFSLVQFLSASSGGVFLLLATLLYVAVLLVVERRSFLELISIQRWVILALAAMTFIALIPFTVPYLRNARSGISPRPTPSMTALYSARPVDFVTPAPNSVLDGVAPWRSSARQPLFPGVVASALALFWLARRGWRGQLHRPELIFYVLLTGAGALLALGPWLGGPDHRIPMPFALAWYVLPGASFIRTPVRFVVLASLGVAVMAGAGAARMKGVRRRGRRWASIGLCVLAAAELFAAPIQILRPLPGGIPAVYSWLGSVTGPLAIIELPMPVDSEHERAEHARYQLYSLAHFKRLANGMAGSIPPITRELRREMQQFPDNASVAMLRELGITYVFVHTDLYPPEEVTRLREAIRNHPGLSLADDTETIWVVDVVTGAEAAR
jgi:hypothetical protein